MFCFTLFATSLKVPFWESIMVAVIRIICSMFGVEIVLLPQYYLLETKCLYHSQTMTMDQARDFLLHLCLVRKWKIFNFFQIIRHVTFFALLKDNLCDNALELKNRTLIVQNNWADGTYCQWLISAQDDVDYVTLEFKNFHVRPLALI